MEFYEEERILANASEDVSLQYYSVSHNCYTCEYLMFPINLWVRCIEDRYTEVTSNFKWYIIGM